MEFEDDAIVLSARPHAETGAIVHLLTRAHGHIAAHVAGGASRRLKAYLQPGSFGRVTYRARHIEQLGAATFDGLAAGGIDIMDDPQALTGLQSACVMTQMALTEREAHDGVYEALSALLTLMAAPDLWPFVYVRYEAGLLDAMGFGLNLSVCTVTGSIEYLAYVSPKTGRAVSLGAGEAYRDKLLPLPGFMSAPGSQPQAGDVSKGLDLTGYFLERHVFHPLNRPLPDIRLRLRDMFES